MAPVSLSFVARFSSQDAIFKAENLCKGKSDASSTWKCAKEDTESGLMEAEFQLERASYISHIDIGNCGSAFIEILVGNSLWSQNKPFVTLLPSAMLMSPVDCKSWTKTHTVRMFSQNAFSKQALGSQWDRIRLICLQPFRKDKQFGLSFIRVASVPEDSAPSSSDKETITSTTPTGKTARVADDESHEDGVTRLKKSSGLMGCLRGLETGSPKTPLNRAGKMLQAALDGKSPHTPRVTHRNERLSCSSPESPYRKRGSINSRSSSSSPESPYRKRGNIDSQSSEGPSEKRTKNSKWSLAGDFHDELALFLEEINFPSGVDLEHTSFRDLRNQLESQRGCALTAHERKIFLEVVKAAMSHLDDRHEDIMEKSCSKSDNNLPVPKLKQDNKPKKKSNKSHDKTPNSSPKEMPKGKMQSPAPSFASTPPATDNGWLKSKQRPTVNLQGVESPSTLTEYTSDNELDELPSMLYSPEKIKSTEKKAEKPSTSNEEGVFGGELEPSPVKSDSRQTFLVECPICTMFFPRSEVEFHAALCTGVSSHSESSFAVPVDNLVSCPVCSKLFPNTEIEQHADGCAESSICEDGNNFGRELISI